MNAASRLAPQLPGSAIAPGSLFSIRGARLTGAEVEVGGKAAKVLYADESRVLAQMPAPVEPGEVAIVVRAAGQSSAPYTVRVKASSFGIFARLPSPALELPAELRDPPAIESGPGKTITLTGTGLGLTAPPDLEVRIGGKKAGRVTAQAGASGIDSVSFEVPAEAPLGCQVPVLVRTGGTWSNTISVTLESGGKPCSEDAAWVSKVLASPGKSGVVMLFRFVFHIDPGNGKEIVKQWDSALADFSQTEASPRSRRFALPPAGTCMTYYGVMALGGFLNPPLPGEVRDPAPEGVTSTDTLRNPFQLPVARRLDAGAFLSIRGKRGEKRLERDPQMPDSYLSHIGGDPPVPKITSSPMFLEPGKFEITSAGGKDVGRLSGQVTMPAPLEWLNRLTYREVTRSEGMTVKWRQRDHTRLVAIIAGAADRVSGAGGLCMCTAAPGTDSFAIPPEALSNLPVTDASEDPGRPVTGVVIASFPGKPEPGFRAEGLDSGYGIPVFVMGQPVSYK